MANEFTEISHSTKCPCGSGATYGKCCVRKQYQYGLSEHGDLVRRIKIDNKAESFFQEAKDFFLDLYGREPASNELVFPFVASSASDFFTPAIRAMRDMGFPEDYIYAYYRTDGLMPTKENLELIPDADLSDFDAFRSEFEELTEGPDDDGRVSTTWLTMNGNNLISTTASEATQRIRMVLRDFISRHQNGASLLNFECRTSLDYCVFSAYRTVKTLESIDRLASYGMPESINALSRGLFESYLFLNAIARDTDLFDRKILPKVDREHYTFARKKNGAINYNKVVHINSGEEHSVWISPDTLLGYSANTSDQDIYDLFYSTTSQLIHVDILSARAYFHEPDIYDELDPAYEAQLVAAILGGMFVQALGEAAADDGYSTDITYFLSTLRQPFSDTLQLVNLDSNTSNAFYNTLLGVITAWPINTNLTAT